MRPRIVVMYGGDAEHAETSRESAAWICQHIPKSEFDVTPVHVTPDGLWSVPVGSLPRTGNSARAMDMLAEANAPLDPKDALARILHKPTDSIVTTLRGRGGDDGAMHTLGDVLHIPVAGSGAHTSRVAHNKGEFLHAISHIAPTPYSQVIRKKSAVEDIGNTLRTQFSTPFFVKPVHGSGSHNVLHVKNHDDIARAIQTIFESEEDFLVQEQSHGDEVSVTVYKRPSGTIASLPPSIVVPKYASYFDYRAKNNSDHTAFFHDHPTGSHAISQAQEIAHATYDALGCNGVATVDMIMSPNGTIDVLELNTIPTFTRHTPVIHQLRHAGIAPELFVRNLLR